VDVNCATLPANLVESELFGHERGAFTDAKSSHRGLVELAGGGTLFLDEIAELSEPAQAKLLKFLDTMRFRRIGGQREIEVELRVIAATNQPVDRLVREGRMREDLYHRLSVFLIDVPPLAARREDIPELARAFVARCADRVKKRVSGISLAAMKNLLEYDYPGNVRELRNIIERAVILAEGAQVEAADLFLSPASRPAGARGPGAFFSVSLDDSGSPPTSDAVERAYVLRVLDHCGGKRTAAAQALGMSYPTFLKRLRDLDVPDE
jgi:DNA-binding NtrC family response regulator